jgi:hypothetical protein
MKPLNLMTDDRMSHLMKVAEECIGLINVDINPNTALKKLAEDNLLTDKEVELVSHAVNNSRQLALYESADSDNKDSPFVLTNAELVNADRYGKASEDSASAEQDQDEPDAVGIADKLQKEASASFVDTGDYRRRNTHSIDTEALRGAFGVTKMEKVAYSSLNVIHPSQAYDVGIDEARTRAAGSREKAFDLIKKAGLSFRNLVGPSFAEFEKVAEASDVPADLINIVYDSADLGRYGVPRAKQGVKTARVYTSREILGLVEMVKEAAQALDDCASALAAKSVLESHRAELVKNASPFSADLQFSPKGLDEEVRSAPNAYLGLGEDPHSTLMDMAGETKPEGYDPSATLDRSTSQEVKNFDTQAELKSLMNDDYIGGYSAPEVIDAYNAAKSVNPNFGQAQLVSYMRQHLATGGGVPLELQVRAGRTATDKE